MLKHHVLGTSVNGQPILVYELKHDAPAMLLVAGIHGDEPQSAFVGDRLVDLLNTRVGDMLDEHLLVIPRLNPDGLDCGTRSNAHGVDINRNFPTTNWKHGQPGDRYYGGSATASEPETQLILDVMRRFTPRRILAIHCIDRPKHCLNFDGPAQALAEAMSKANGYEVRADIGHPTPGSIGTWMGYDRKIPVVTLELPADEEPEKCWQDNRDAIMNFIQAEP